MRTLATALTLTLIAFFGAACRSEEPPGTGGLVFEPEVRTDESGEFVITLKVRNDGAERTEARGDANARMELRDERGGMRASTSVAGLPAMEPGEAVEPGQWRGPLEPGAYELEWGAPGLGGSVTAFRVLERAGRLELGEPSVPVRTNGDEPGATVPAAARPLVEMAVAQLAAQLSVPADAISVQRVEAVDFPDASLGVPDPDLMYAQVVTPGFVIELGHEGQSYVFHGSGQQLVPLPRD
jgi:hypothetical protein